MTDFTSAKRPSRWLAMTVEIANVDMAAAWDVKHEIDLRFIIGAVHSCRPGRFRSTIS